MTNLDKHIKKQRHYFANKGLSRQTMVFPVVMYGFESWTMKKAEHRRIDVFELWCKRRLLKSPMNYKEIQPVTLKEISAECSLEGLMLKLQYFYYLM